jgi:hypothetical protein
MKTVIRIIANATGIPCPEAGLYVKDMDVDAFDGIGHLSATSRPLQARHFDDLRQALAYYRRTSKVRPVRPDGRPNRPLTAYTVEIGPAPGPAQ